MTNQMNKITGLAVLIFLSAFFFLSAGIPAYSQELEQITEPEITIEVFPEPDKPPLDQPVGELAEFKLILAELTELMEGLEVALGVGTETDEDLEVTLQKLEELAPLLAMQNATQHQDPLGEELSVLLVPIFFILIVMGVAGFSLIWKSLFPRKTEWCVEIAKRMPVGSFFLGLGLIIVVLILVMAFASAGDAVGAVAMLILALFLLFFGSFKIAAMVEWVGGMIDPMSSGIRHALYGSSGLLLLLAIPVLGWIVLFGFACIGIGSALMSYFPTRTPAADASHDTIHAGDDITSKPDSE